MIFKVLMFFQNELLNAYKKAGILNTATTWQNSGERFSTTIHTRQWNGFADDRISHLVHVSFEFLHLYRQRCNDKPILEAGTFHYAQERSHRKNDDPSALKLSDANKDFFPSYFKANLVEGALLWTSLGWITATRRQQKTYHSSFRMTIQPGWGWA